MLKNYLIRYGFSTLFSSIMMIFIGILFIINPGGTLRIVCTGTGLAFIFAGLIEVILFLFSDRDVRIYSNGLAEGAVELLLGLSILLFPETVITLFPIIIGGWALFKAMIKIQVSLMSTNIIEFNWVWLLICGIIQCLFALIILINPFASAITITLLLGILLLVLGVIELTQTIYMMKGLRKQTRNYL